MIAWFCAWTEQLFVLYYPVKAVFCIAVFTIESILFWNIGKRFDKSKGFRIKMILLPPVYLWRLVYEEEV